jgi:hypothetical protein
LAASILGSVASDASATTIGPDAFLSPTIVDFINFPDREIGAFYAGLGVTFTNLCGSPFQDTGTGHGRSTVAANFFCVPNFPSASADFSSLMTRVGFYITTNPDDNVTVSAFRGGSLVGSESFDTGGAGNGGSFAGIEFLSGFDRIVIDAARNINGAFAIDDFRFEAVPEPASLALLGSGLLAMTLRRLRTRRR